MKRELIGEADLHAFVDGDLDERRTALVRKHLDDDAGDAERVETWRRQSADIRRAFDHPLGTLTLPKLETRRAAIKGPIAAEEMPRLDRILASRRRRHVSATVAAFIVGASVAAIGAIAVSRVGPMGEQPFVGEAAPLNPAAEARRARLAWRTYMREAIRSSDRVVDDDRTRAEGALRRTAALPHIPDFSRDGFALTASRTMPGEAEPAAFLAYESPAQIKVALIVERTPDSDRDAVLSDDGGLRCLLWKSAGYAFALVGPAEAATLRALARQTFATMSTR